MTSSPVKPDANLTWRPRADQPRYRSVVKAYGVLSGYQNEETARRHLREIPLNARIGIHAFRLAGQEERLPAWTAPIIGALKVPGWLPPELLEELKHEYHEALIREQWTRHDLEREPTPQRWHRWRNTAFLVVHLIYALTELQQKQWETA